MISWFQTLFVTNATCTATPRRSTSRRPRRSGSQRRQGCHSTPGYQIGYVNHTCRLSSIRLQNNAAKGANPTRRWLLRAPIFTPCPPTAGLYKSNAVDPQLESTWLQPLDLICDFLVLKIIFSKSACTTTQRHRAPRPQVSEHPHRPPLQRQGGGAVPAVECSRPIA
jgi:hypothetical protein